MNVNAIFITDYRGLELSRFGIASFILSQTDCPDVTLYCDGFELPHDDVLFKLARSAGTSFATRPISSQSFQGHTTAAHISLASYVKLAAAKDAIRDYDRVFYADTDILFFKPLRIRDLDFRGYPIAAAYDVAETTSITDPSFAANCKNHGISTDYFNSGLIYLNGSACDLDLTERAYAEAAKEHERSCKYKNNCRTGDQCIWNVLFMGNWLRLPIDWNVQASMRFTSAWAQASARHHTGPVKFLPARPWRSDRRETEYIRLLASRLGVAIEARSSPFDFAYHLNGLRWLRSRLAIGRSIADVNRRIESQAGPLKVYPSRVDQSLHKLPTSQTHATDSDLPKAVVMPSY